MTGSDQFEVERRPSFLEGMRGLAAWAVVFNHTFNTFLPGWTGAAAGPAELTLWSQRIAYSPLFLFFSGPFAVILFFVHSGLVLSFKFFARGGDANTLRSAASRRYIRLAGPAVASILFAYLFMKLGLVFSRRVAGMTGSAWLNGQFGFLPHLGLALRQGIVDYFFASNIPSETSYNSSLWTIQTEFIGSFLVFAFLALFGAQRRRWLFYIVGVALLFKSFLLAFLAGIMLCDFYVWYFRVCDADGARFDRVAWLILLCGLYLGGFRTGAETHLIYAPLQFAVKHQVVQQSRIFGAFLTILGLMLAKPAQRFLRRDFLQYLGKISYSVYLLHLLLLCSVGCGIYVVVMKAGWGSPVGKAVATGVTFFLIFFCSAIFREYVDKPSIRLSSMFWEWLNEKSKSKIRFGFPLFSVRVGGIRFPKSRD